MNELEIIHEKKDKWSAFQEKYNTASKSIVSVFGANISLFICFLLPILLVGFIWTEFGAPQIGISLVSDGVVSVALFIVGELMMMRVGADGGKLDKDYLAAKKDYSSLVERVNAIGTMYMRVFCEWQIDIEYEQAMSNRLKALQMTRIEWDRVKDKSYKELKNLFGKHKAKAIISLANLQPIELNEPMLLYDTTEERLTRGGIPISGAGYMKKQSHSVGMLLGTIFTCLLTVSFAVTLTSDISFSRVMYTAVKLVLLLFRMAKGYEKGARAYNTVEVVQLQAKSGYLRLYERFVSDKLYLSLGDKYGNEEIQPTEEAVATETN